MTMQTEIVIEELALNRGGWLINRLDFNYAERLFVIDAVYDEQTLRLIFRGFHLSSWQSLHKTYEPGTVNVDVIGLDLGEEGERKAAVLHTDLFEIMLTYDDLTIEKAW